MSFPRRRNRGFLLPPDLAELERLAILDGLELAPGEAAELLPAVAALVATANDTEELDQVQLRTPFTVRDPGYVPSATEDPFNVFIRKCRVEGNPSGPLAGMRIGLKDNISLAAYPPPTRRASPASPRRWMPLSWNAFWRRAAPSLAS